MDGRQGDSSLEQLRSQSPAPSDTSITQGRSGNLSAAQKRHLGLQGNAAAMPSFSSRPSSSLGTRLPNPPTFVEWNGLRFLVMDAPSENNLELYLRELRRHHVRDLVRVCDPTYSRETVERQGIRLHELLFPDGDGPPDNIISSWMSLVDARFGRGSRRGHVEREGRDGAQETTKPETEKEKEPEQEEEQRETIAVHCVAGLGRAPVLVAIALIEAGMSPLDAVTFLRERRRGAINNKQLRFLESYRRRFRFTSSQAGGSQHSSSASMSSSPKCLLM